MPVTSFALPVEHIAPDAGKTPQNGIALCLSGGGYRAMLFHVGALWRLNEVGYLSKLARISSVSGGSITAGVLGMNWPTLSFDVHGVAQKFKDALVVPVRRVAGITIDQWAILSGALGPGSISDRVAGAYRKYLFGRKTLQDLPPDPPRFVINATNVQSGALWRFSRPYMADWRVGMIKHPSTDLATAVAASSAFPPFLSPAHLDLQETDFVPNSGHDLQMPPFTTEVVLTDGGVYDNLGLETAWKEYTTILVSDGGGNLQAEADPPSDWLRHVRRVLDVIDNQVCSLRKRQLIDSYKLLTGQTNHRDGVYWGVRSDITQYPIATAAGYPFNLTSCPVAKTLALAEFPTRLKAVDPYIQERLINWGYAICDAALHSHVDGTLPVPSGFPYPSTGI